MRSQRAGARPLRSWLRFVPAWSARPCSRGAVRASAPRAPAQRLSARGRGLVERGSPEVPLPPEVHRRRSDAVLIDPTSSAIARPVAALVVVRCAPIRRIQMACHRSCCREGRRSGKRAPVLVRLKALVLPPALASCYLPNSSHPPYLSVVVAAGSHSVCRIGSMLYSRPPRCRRVRAPAHRGLPVPPGRARRRSPTSRPRGSANHGPRRRPPSSTPVSFCVLEIDVPMSLGR